MDDAAQNQGLTPEEKPITTNDTNLSNVSKPTTSQIQKLDDKIKSVSLPQDLQEKVVAMVDRLRLIGNDSSFFIELDSTSRYIDWVTNLPWEKRSEDILNLTHAKEVLDKNHFGLTDVKNNILEYLAIMIMKANKNKTESSNFARAPIISLVGLAGVGKTSIAYSIAEALGRKIERVPFGGMGSATQLRGKTRLFADSEPGLIIKALKHAGTNNPVILLDEIDRVSEDARADIMGVLIELLDPEQNSSFTDHFIDYPVNLSNVLFIATSNNTKDISTAVLDRLEIIQMPSYSDTEKTTIGKQFIFPKALAVSGMASNNLVIADEVWADFIIRPLGYDPGLRSLQRVLNGVVRKVAYNMLTGLLPQDKQFILNMQNIKQYVSQW
jgi:ATP-dependent Lon protease